MKKIIIIMLLIICISVKATASPTSGMTYCISEYDSNFVVDWKKKTIIFTSYGLSDTYTIIKESKDGKSGTVITARKYFDGGVYAEFKIINTPQGDFFRVWDANTKQYCCYRATRLSCWDEQQ